MGNLKENNDIRAIKFLGKNESFKIDKDLLLKLKDLSQSDIDEESFKLLQEDIESMPIQIFKLLYKKLIILSYVKKKKFARILII